MIQTQKPILINTHKYIAPIFCLDNSDSGVITELLYSGDSRLNGSNEFIKGFIEFGITESFEKMPK